MHRFFVVATFVLLVAAVPRTIVAQDAAVTQETVAPDGSDRTDVKKDGVRKKVIDRKNEALQRTKEKARGASEKKQRWEELSEAREKKREQMKEEIQSRKKEAKARVSAVRDGKKRVAVERIQERITSVNAARMDHFLSVLARLSTIIDKMNSRMEKASQEGKDTSSVESAISSASVAVAAAEDAITTQQEKTYQVVVTSDEAARSEVGTTVKQMQEDVRKVGEAVKSARDAVHRALQQLKTLTQETQSGATTP